MNSDLVKSNNAVTTSQLNISMEEIKRLICPQASDVEIEVFKKKCEALNLNPFLNEIYLVKYGNQKAQHIVNYLTYIQTAEKTGLLDGYQVDIADDKESATITIYRKDWKHPFKKTIWKEEFDKKQSIWKEKPIYMLEKVAIACGFRQCFTLTALPYTKEEIQSMQDESQQPINESTPIFNQTIEEPQQVEAETVEAEIVTPKTAEEIISDLCALGYKDNIDSWAGTKSYDVSNLSSSVKSSIEKRPDAFREAIMKIEVK